jgi:SPP1 family predicted phage head-tail adaptor
MEIGKLRHKIEIQSRADPDVPDKYGETAEEWTTVLSPWASIEPASGKQLYLAEQMQTEVSHVVTIRHYSALTTQHRIKFGTRILNINFVRNVDERNVFQEVYCKEAV